jgi:hypothetical protein
MSVILALTNERNGQGQMHPNQIPTLILHGNVRLGRGIWLAANETKHCVHCALMTTERNGQGQMHPNRIPTLILHGNVRLGCGGWLAVSETKHCTLITNERNGQGQMHPDRIPTPVERQTLAKLPTHRERHGNRLEQRHGLQNTTLTSLSIKIFIEKLCVFIFYENDFQNKSIDMIFTFLNSTT